jgi:hypothetical protein
MPIKTDLNVNPYFDDFDEDKLFHRVLFKPGVAVQARELTQLQTILQNQVERFGDFIFEDGSIVVGCNFQYDNNLKFVKLRDQNKAGVEVDVNTFLTANAIVFSNTTGASAKVVAVATGSEVTSPDLKTLFVKYIDGGSTNTVKSFTDGEELYGIYSNGSQFQANVASSSATGSATKFGVDGGIIYSKGNFVKVANQSIILSKYNNTPSFEVGFKVLETTPSALIDNSLNDNATGTTNFQAPGADRLKLTPTLAKRPINQTSNTEPFFAIFSVEDGNITRRKQTAQLDELGKKLAQQTHEESGDFMTNPINIRIQEHLNTNTNFGYFMSDGSNGTAGDVNKLVALTEGGGTAYVQGFRNEILQGVPTEVNKGTTIEYQNAQSVTLAYGNYVKVQDVAGSFDVKNGRTISLRDAASNGATRSSAGNYYSEKSASDAGNEIGTANFIGFSYDSDPSSGAEEQGRTYRVYLYNIKMNAGKSFGSVRSLFIENGTNTTPSYDTFADVVLTNSKAVLQDTTSNKLIYPVGYEALYKLRDSSGTNDNIFLFSQRSNGSFATGGTATVNLPSAHAGGTEVTKFSAGSLSAANKKEFIVTFTETAYSQEIFVGSTAGNVITRSSGSTSLDTRFNVGDLLRVGVSQGSAFSDLVRVSAITSTTVTCSNNSGGNINLGSASGRGIEKAFPAGYILDMSDKGGDTGDRDITIAGAKTSFVIDTKETFTTTPNFSVNYPIQRTGAEEMDKTVQKNRFVKIDCSKSYDFAGILSLGVSDVFNIRKIYIGSDYSISNVDRAAEFELVDGQKDTHYENSGIRIKSSSTFTLTSADRILVEFDFFERSRTNGIGFFSVDSYPTNDATSDPAAAINTAEIPLYISDSGQKYDLRNHVDFRSAHGFANGTPATSASSARVAKATSNTVFDIDSDGVYAPAINENFTADLGYYLGRKDKIVITKDGEIKVIEGTPSLYPSEPRDQSGAMTLATLDITPYPSISPAAGRTFKRLDIASRIRLVEQRRYTMKDIGKIDRRVQRLEYYSALNQLEQSVLNIQNLDSTGNERFKNGIFTDSFVTHKNAQTADPDYSIAVDKKRGEIRPRYTSELIDTKFNSSTSNNVVRRPEDFVLTVTANTTSFVEGENVFLGSTFAGSTAAGKILEIANTNSAFGSPGIYKLFVVSANGTFVPGTGTLKRQNATLTTANITAVSRPEPGDLVTLHYSHKPFINQPFASKRRFLVNDLTFNWQGRITLDPPADIWKDTVNLPEIQVSVDLFPQFESLAQAFGTQWEDEWRTVETTADIVVQTAPDTTVTNTTTPNSREFLNGDQLSVTPGGNDVTFGDFVQDVSIVPFIRERLVKFTGRGLRPNTKVFPYFDKIKVSDYVTPANSSFANTASEGSNIVTDVNGNVFGVFRVPNDDKLKFRTGTKVFSLLDAENLPADKDTITTSAGAEYQAEGLELATRGNDLNVITGRLEAVEQLPQVQPFNFNFNFTAFDFSGFNLGGGDPLAQSFFVPDTEKGGVFITRLDLHFFSRGTYPVTVQLREMSNGQITNRVVPFGESTLTPEEINLCTESRNPTVFVFNTPVHLQAGKEYAFIVKPHGDDPLPRISVAELGGTDLLTSRIISKVPASGMLFASQNDRTYRPIQNEDIKYKMFRAAFTTVDKGVAYFENDPDDFFSIDNINGTFKAGEKLRGASNVAIVDIGRGDFGTTSNSAAIQIGARVRGLTTGAVGLVRAKNTVGGNTVKIIVDSANTFQPNETLKITYGGDTGFGNTVFGKVSQATGSAANTTQANTSTGFVQFFDPVFNRLTVNSSTGTFSAATNTGTSFIRGQQSNAVARITAVRNIKLNAIVPKFASIAYGNSNITFSQKLSSNAFALPSGAGSFTSVTPGVTNVLNEEKIVASRTNEIDNMSSAKSYTTRAIMTTDNDRVSPVIGIKKAASVLGVQNIINNPSNFETKEVVPGGPAQARYISKPVVLADGQDAEDLKVYTTAFKPQGAEVTVYARLLSASDNDKIEQKHFTKLTQVTSANTLSTSANDFREYEFKLPSSNATQASAFLNSLNSDVVRYASNTDNSLHDTFKQYQIKIVITSDDSAKIARVTDLRTIALQV